MHAENGSAIDVIVQQALAEGKKAPKYLRTLTRPTTAEAEATARAIALAEMAGAPIYIVHMSCNDALEKVREARDRGLPVYGETCPSISTSQLRTSTARDLKVRSTCSLRPCGRNGIRKNSGMDLSATICRWCQPITARSASRNRKKWAATISRRFQMVDRAWSIG